MRGHNADEVIRISNVSAGRGLAGQILRPEVTRSQRESSQWDIERRNPKQRRRNVPLTNTLFSDKEFVLVRCEIRLSKSIKEVRGSDKYFPVNVQ